MNGIENYHSNGGNNRLTKGQFLILKENQKYEVSFENKKNATLGICIDLSLNNINERLIDLYENEILFNTIFSCYSFSPLGDSFQFFSEQTANKMNGIEILSSISSQLISFSDEVLEIQMRLSSVAKKIETKRMLVVKLMTSKDFIYKNYNSKITLNHLALESGISKFHFSKLFKNCFQKSPLELQELLRMRKAKKMILTREIKLTDIAFYLGYSDLAAFSNRFKKHFGIPPSSIL